MAVEPFAPTGPGRMLSRAQVIAVTCPGVAVERARTTEGAGLEAFPRIVPEHFGLQKVIMPAFGGEDRWDEASREVFGPARRALDAPVERGQADGSVDPEVAPSGRDSPCGQGSARRGSCRRRAHTRL